jgi:hypothetical protein
MTESLSLSIQKQIHFTIKYSYGIVFDGEVNLFLD